MALEDLLKLSQGGQLAPKIGMSEERVLAQLQPIRDAVSFWREYPDYFVDFEKGSNPENFSLFFYQRIFLRAVMRHRYAYATFPRAYSKSFLSVMVLMIRCILYPGSKLFVTTGGESLPRLIPELSWKAKLAIAS